MSELCLRRALEQASGSLVAQVHVVCVAEEQEGAVRLPSGAILSHVAAAQWLAEIAGALARDARVQGRTPAVATHLLTGAPAPAIVEVAYRYHTELIIMGARSKAMESGTIGSVAQAVLDLSEIPVQLETHWRRRAESAGFNPVRFAYVFGGPDLRQGGFGSFEGRGAASA